MFSSLQEGEKVDYQGIQRLANKSTADAYEFYRHHREKTMGIIRETCATLEKDVAKILIIGVGNANDLDLLELTTFAKEVWLMDIDEVALNRSLQILGTNEKIRKWVGDAGGMAREIDEFRQEALAKPGQLKQIISDFNINSNFPNKHFIPGTEIFDLVVSQCVLSQILWPLTQTVWDITKIPWHEGQRKLAESVDLYPFRELAEAVIKLSYSHLAWLINALIPGGTAIINSDMSWNGTPLFGTDLIELSKIKSTDNLPDSVRKLTYKKAGEWVWKLDETTTAQVKSLIIEKQI